ncbi:MAG: hypothetical protein K2I63_03215, partial [Helicobacter sp.]|nr:hypothetical protein [Helicobacter sp.]
KLHNNISLPVQFNTAIPMRLEVLKKIRDISYLIKVGNIALETKSFKELEIGGKYWATIKKSSSGSIMLSNLIKEPHFMQDKDVPLKFDAQTIEKILTPKTKEKSPFESFKDFLSERLVQAQSKWEFVFLSHLLISLKQKVLTLPLCYEEKKNGILQLRKRKGKTQECLEFYSIFAHLGAISGVLYKLDQTLRLDIDVLYENVANLLQDNLKTLSLIANISINPHIKPLYDFSDSLLDVEG